MEKRQAQLSGWDPEASSATGLFCRAPQQACPRGWPRPAVLGAGLSLRHHPGCGAKGAELNWGINTLLRWAWVPGAQKSNSRHRDRAQGELRATARAPVLFHPTPPNSTSQCSAKSLAKQSSPGITCLGRAFSTLPLLSLHKYHYLIFLFFFLMCLLNPISFQETWLMERICMTHTPI